MGWKAAEDSATGRVYYYNKETKETRWDNPDAEVGEGANVWMAVVDEASGKTYWFNKKTQETRFCSPE